MSGTTMAGPATDFLQSDFGLLADLLRLHAIEQPGKPALMQDDAPDRPAATISYAALDATMDRIAAALQRDGLGKGDAIAVVAATSLNYAMLYLGTLRAGLAVAPLAPSSTPESLAAMALDADAKILFLDADAEAALASLPPGLASGRFRRIRLDDGSFEAWLAPEGSKPRPVDIAPDDAFNIIYSSGTTGTPKGIVQPHRMRWGHVRRGAFYGYDANSITLLSTPLYSNTTLTSFFPTLGLGGCALLMAKFDPQKYLQLAEKHRVTHTMLVPVQYARLLQREDFGRYDLSAFRGKFSTSAPLSAELKADILKRWPGGMTEVYGMTEGGGACLLQAHLFPDKLHTVGRPAPGHVIKLIDDAGHEVAAGETGEIVGHSGAIMNGYHNQPDKTAEAEWFDTQGRRYIRTGDIGRFDEDGFLILLDRKKDLIISGGFNIYPSDLEATLSMHPAVAECAVVGVPSERWGETPMGFAVLKPGATDTAETILAATNAQLGKTQRLAGLHLLDTLPRSAIGKILKRDLRAMLPPG